MLSIDEYMKIAIDQARLSIQEKEVPVGCIFVHKLTGEIVKAAHNITNRSRNATQHCEIQCINTLKDCSDYDLYVTCEPCIMCAYALNLAKINQVYYGCGNTRFGGNGSVLKVNEYPSQGGILAEECMAILQTFYAEGNQNIAVEQRHRKKIKTE